MSKKVKVKYCPDCGWAVEQCTCEHKVCSDQVEELRAIARVFTGCYLSHVLDRAAKTIEELSALEEINGEINKED